MIRHFRRLLDIFRPRPVIAPSPAAPRACSGGRFVRTTCYGRLVSAHLRIQVVAVFDLDDNRHSAYKIYLN